MNPTPPLAERLALVFTPAERRPAAAALETVLSEIAASLAPSLDHTVAHTRLGWWREEVGRLLRGQPLHPACRALLAAAPQARYARLEGVLAATEFQLAGHAPTDETALATLIEHLYGAPETLRAEVLLNGTDPRLDAFGRALGTAFGYTEVALAAPGAPAVSDLARVKDALAGLVPTPSLALAERPGLVRAALLAARLTPGGLQPPPGPLTSLWIAWRCARRHRLELR